MTNIDPTCSATGASIMGSMLRRRSSWRGGFTWLDLLGVIACVGLILLLAVVTCQPRHHHGRPMQNSTQVRGIHSGLVLYAQGNNGYYPGLSNTGEVVYADVETRFLALLNDNYFTGEYIIAPVETKAEWKEGTPLTTANYSYAMLAIATPGGRQSEWRDTSNSEAPVLSDRNAGTNWTDQVWSVHTGRGKGWRGSVAYNDNHVNFASSHQVDTKYGEFAFKADNLFHAEGPNDAWMIYAGSGDMP